MLQDEINSTGSWLWREFEKINCRNKISNNEVFAMENKQRCLIRTIRQRQKNWIEHMLRGDGFLTEVVEEESEGEERGR